MTSAFVSVNLTNRCFLIETSFHEKFANSFLQLKHYIFTFNVFPSNPPSSDRHQLQSELISTRVFIAAFTLSLAILILYTSLVTVTKTVSVDTPSLTQYSQLYSKHFQTLVCPCRKISIKYEKILTVNYTLHQVCTSFLINSNWINHFRRNQYVGVSVKDFRFTSILGFQGLRSFCNIVNQIIFDALIAFYSTEYVSGSVTPVDVFQSQIEESTRKFRQTTAASFLSSISTIRSTTQSNVLYSVLLTNLNYFIDAQNHISAITRSYPNCTCVSSAICSEQSSIYQYYDHVTLFTVPGFYTGCYPTEALLQSNLECFYNQSCIDTLKSYLPSASSMTTVALDSSLTSEYKPTSTINDLLSQLMIEQWNLSTMYGGYYNECQPTQCVYSYETRNDAIYIVTTVIGLIGGLITVLKLLVPRLVKFVRKQRVVQRPTRGKKIGKVLPCDA